MAMCKNRIGTVCIAWTRPSKECTSVTKLPPTQQSSWCFENRRKPFMRRPHLFVPHRFLTSQIHAEYVLHDRSTAGRLQTWSVYFSARPRCTRSSRGKLVSKGAAWGQLSKPWARGSVCCFRRATLSQRDTYRASLMGDQATMKRRLGAVDGRRLVDSMLAVVCSREKRME